MRTELDDSIKVAMMIETLREYNKFEPLITATSVAKEEDAS